MNTPKIIVIYHRADFDGIFCREIAKRYFGDKAEYIGWDYNDPVPAIPAGATVYMLDISVEALMDSAELVWIDHHKSAIEKYDSSGWIHEPAGKDSFGVPYNEFWRRGHETRTTEPLHIAGLRIDGVAACRLAWQFFFGNQRAEKSDYEMRQVDEPLAVRLAGEYDIWDKRDPDADSFQFGLRSVKLTEQNWRDLLDMSPVELLQVQTSQVLCASLLENGRLIQDYQREKDAGIAKFCSFVVEFEGLKFLALNSAGRGSMQFATKDVPETGHDALMKFSWTGKEWDVSLYHAGHRKDLDLSLIAARHNGGGHRGACGFRTLSLPFLPADEENAQLRRAINIMTKCPHCKASLVHANPGDGSIDTYCEECGWPDEMRD